MSGWNWPLSHHQGHAAETERDLETGLNAPQLENDAVAVLQRCHLAAADDRAACARARIGAGNGAGTRQIARGADQIHRRDTEAADADAADRQRISDAMEDQDAAAAADADDESGLDDMQADVAHGLRL